MFRKMIFTGAALVGGALLALCIAVPGAYATQPVTVPLDFFVFDDCNGDTIHFVGTEKFSFTVTVQNDILHVKIHEGLHADGTGSLGSYVLNFEANEEENIKLINNTGEANLTENVNVIGKGAVANEIIKVTAHITVNANGTVTVDRVDESLTCHK